MRGHRLAGPERAGLRRCLVADREYEVHKRRARLRELIPVFAPQAFGGEAISLKQFQRERMHATGWMASRTKGFELALSNGVKDRLRHDAPCRIASAQKQNIERALLIHGSVPYAQHALDFAGRLEVGSQQTLIPGRSVSP